MQNRYGRVLGIEDDVLMDHHEPNRITVYEYLGNGRVLKDGVEITVASLTESERVTVGEQVLRDTSAKTGVSVSELRKVLVGIAGGQISVRTTIDSNGDEPVKMILDTRTKPEFSKMVTPDGKPVLAHIGKNRKERRSESTLKRRARLKSKRSRART